MGPKSVVHAGEVGLTSVVEGVAKVRGALPDNVREAADRRLGAGSTLGKGVLAMVDTVAEESAKAKEARAALAVEAAAARAAAAAVAQEKAVAIVDSAQASATESGGRGGKVLLAGLALGAAAGGTYLVWKRRQQAARDHLSGEEPWASATGGTVSDLPATVSAEAADAAEEVSDITSDVAEEVSDAAPDLDSGASELAGEASDAAGDADAAALSFNEQIDEVADSLSADVVAAIETPEGGVKGA